MTSAALFLLLLAQPADAAPVVVLPARAVGLDAAGTKAAEARIAEQIRGLGLTVEARREAPAEGCLDDEACRASLTDAKAGLLDLELLRFGPDVTLTARLFDGSGALVAASERSLAHEAFASEPALLGEEVVAALRALAAEQATASPPDALPEDPTPSPPSAPAAPDDESDGLSVVGLSLTGAAAAVGLAGALVGGAGVASYLLAQQVLGNPEALRPEKDQMIVVRYAGAGLVAIGLLALVAGGTGAGVSTLLW